MKAKVLSTVFALILSCIAWQLSAQVALNTDGSLPDNSAMLDVKSTTRGMLVPRMTAAQRDAISNPANGLLIFCADNNQYYSYHAGGAGGTWMMVNTQWTSIGQNINYPAGNVGIGTSNPTHARMEINGSVGASVAMFGADKCGITIEADNPEIGFNYFFNGTTKTIKAGYGALLGMDPGSGNLYFGNFNGNQSASNFGDITGYQTIATFSQTGKLALGMTPSANNSRLQVGCDAFHAGIGLYYSGTFCGDIRPANGNIDIEASHSTSGVPGNLILQKTDYVGIPVSYAGDVVIGTAGPSLAKLHVEGAEGNTVAMFRTFSTKAGISIVSDWPGIFSNCYFNEGPKTMAATGYSAAMNFNQDDGSIDFLTRTAANTAANASITLVESMRIGRDGRVAIGTSYPANGYLLSIGGKAICEELTVKYKVAWPDYVFSENYKLTALPDLENYILSNKHLPDIPEASEIDQEGINIGEMQKKMMEKIEELTLYIIAQDKKIRHLESMIIEKKQN